MGKRIKHPPLVLPRFFSATTRVLARNRRPLTRRELHRLAQEPVLQAIAATCVWEERTETPLGDYRSVVFYAAFGRDSGASVHFWAFPHHPVLIEVSWDADDATAASFPPDVAARLTRFGFRANAEKDNYARDVTVKSMSDARRTARLVLDLFHDVFGYRGTVPIDVQTVYDGCASEEFVYESFSAEEIAWIAARLGYAARVVFEDTDAATARIAIRRGRNTAEIVLADAVKRQQYGSGFLGSPAVPPSARRGVRQGVRRGRNAVKPDAWRVGVTVHFEGGVTAEWVAQRIEYGMALIAGRTPRSGPLLNLSEPGRPPRQLPHIYSVEEVAANLSVSVPEVEDAITRHLRSLKGSNSE